MGVPIIVNQEIRELSEFVLKHKCGVVLNIYNGKVEYVNYLPEALDSKEFWKIQTQNT